MRATDPESEVRAEESDGPEEAGRRRRDGAMRPGFGRKDYYRILQVHGTAHPEVVRAAFRTLLRVLGGHPDLGGRDSDARALIEAYHTLSDPERRRAYDLWLQAHSGSSQASPILPPGIANWIRIVLPEYRDAPEAPFGGRFDLVLAKPGPLGGYLYVKAFSVLRRASWPTVLTLSRAVRLARTGFLPSTDVLVVVAPRVQDVGSLLEEVDQSRGRGAWNRCAVAVCTLFPLGLHTRGASRPPDAIRRLRSHLAGAKLTRPAP